jgi:hypothetical protein
MASAIRRVALSALIIGALFGLSTAIRPEPAALAKEETQFFPETGKTVRGPFLAYWRTHGALRQIGYPLSDELPERSATDGQVYTVQYFEWAVLEAHPQNPPPYDVLLALLGAFDYQARYPHGAPGQTPNPARDTRLYPPTGKHLGGPFREYWDSYGWPPDGSLGQMGYPISEEFAERTAEGTPLRVQYFQRAVLERGPDENLRVRPLGTLRYQARYGAVPALITTRATCPATLRGPSISDPIDPAPARDVVGHGHLLQGRVRSSADCAPLAGATIVLWLAGPDGQYDDAHRGTVRTGSAGAYHFESNFPAFYGAGGPHIHLYVTADGYQALESEYFVPEGETVGTFNLNLVPRLR